MNEEDEQVVSKTTDLRDMVYHTDARVTAMEGQLTGLGQAMNRIEAHMMNKPPFNAAPWISIGLVILFAGIGGMFTGMKYIQLTQEPLRADIQDLRNEDRLERDREQRIEDFMKETHYQVGLATTKDEHHDNEFGDVWKSIHKLETLTKEIDNRLPRS